MSHRREEDLRSILHEEFKKEQKSQRKLVLILAALVIIAVISATLFLTNLLSAVTEGRPATTDQSQELVQAQDPSDLPTPNDQQTPDQTQGPSAGLNCDYGTNPPTCTTA